MTIEKIKKLNLPDTPGVYFFMAKSKILYIGRATSLRDRVKSYFSNDLIQTRGPRVVDMVTAADSVTWETTDSVLEAIILEANLIKRHQPVYNVKEKDDKSWSYVCITNESFPRVLVIRGKDIDFENTRAKGLDLNSVYGPFTSGSILRESLRIIRRMFPFLDEKSVSKDAYRFYRQLGLTPDVLSEEARSVYMSHIRHIKLFFQGKKSAVVASLKKEMMLHAKKREFEKASLIKKRIFALEHIKDVSLIKTDKEHTVETEYADVRIEAYDVAHTSGKESVGVMTVVQNGEISKSQYRKFKISSDIGNNDVKSLSEILNRRFSHGEWQFPHVAVIDGGIQQRNVAEKLISTLSPNTAVVSVVKNESHKPKGILGDASVITRYKKLILLANAEAHRFAITYHRKRLRER